MKQKKRHLISATLAAAAAMLPLNVWASEGHTTTMAEAWFNTFLGVGTVFVMLIVMSLIIYCFRLIPMIQDKLTKKGKTEETVEAAPVAAYEPVEETDDLELVAVIAAAIAASEQIPLDSFRVRTIKRRY